MIDRNGEEWAPIATAARRVRVREDLIRQWKARGKIRAHRLPDVHETWVNLPDVAGRGTSESVKILTLSAVVLQLVVVDRAELAWRRRGRRPLPPTPDRLETP